jgi:hypothetical protein
MQQGSVDTLAAVPNRTHIAMADPPLDRTGSGDLESVAGNLWGDFRPPQGCGEALSGFPWEFERLSHVAVNFQS